eukprot:TRINITY_DN12273_c0_g2_i1.p1 TRINITY_DN12273_c0_g2~~TRINITY_DN12273_c0_g2_i1.p1  ORF type:complete len:2409 (+),score=625.03 TRINITY_DN12273_c0_g2_i1:678-7229(+)
MAHVAIKPETRLTLQLTVDLKQRRKWQVLFNGEPPQEAWVHPVVVQNLTTVTFHNTDFKIPQFMSFFSKKKRGARSFAEVLAGEFFRTPLQSVVRFAETCTVSDTYGRIRPIPLSWVPEKKLSTRPPIQLRLFAADPAGKPRRLQDRCSEGIDLQLQCTDASVAVEKGEAVSRVFTVVSSFGVRVRLPADGDAPGDARLDITLQQAKALGGWQGQGLSKAAQVLADAQRLVIAAERRFDAERGSYLGKVTLMGSEGDTGQWLGVRLTSGDVKEMCQISAAFDRVLDGGGQQPREAPTEEENIAIQHNLEGTSNVWRPSAVEIHGEVGRVEVILVDDKDGFDSEGARFGFDAVGLEGVTTYSGMEYDIWDVAGVNLTVTQSAFFDTYNATASSWDSVLSMGLKATYLRQMDIDVESKPFCKQSLAIEPWQRNFVEGAPDGISVTLNADSLHVLILLMKRFHPSAIASRGERERIRNMTSAGGPCYVVKNETGLPVTVTAHDGAHSLGGAYQARIHLQKPETVLTGSSRTPATHVVRVVMAGSTPVPGDGAKVNADLNFVPFNRANRKLISGRHFGAAKLMFEAGAHQYIPYCVADTRVEEGAMSTTLRSTVLIRNECSFPLAIRLNHHLSSKKLAGVLKKRRPGSELVAEDSVIIIPAASDRSENNNVCAVPLAYVQPHTGFNVCPLSGVLGGRDGAAMKEKIERAQQQGNLRGVATTPDPDMKCFDWSVTGGANRDGTGGVPLFSQDKRGDRGHLNEKRHIVCPVRSDPVPSAVALNRLSQRGLVGGCHLAVVYTPSWKAHELPSSGLAEDLLTRDLELVIQPKVKVTNMLPFAIRCHVTDSGEKGAAAKATELLAPELSSIVFELKRHLARAETESQSEWAPSLREAIQQSLASGDASHWLLSVLREYGWKGDPPALTAAPTMENTQGLIRDLTYAADPWVVRPGRSVAFLGIAQGRGYHHLAFTALGRGEPVRSNSLVIPKTFTRGYYRNFDYHFRLDASGERVNMTHLYSETTQSASTELLLWAPIWLVNKLDASTCTGIQANIVQGGGMWLWSQRQRLNRAPLHRGEPFVCSFANDSRTERMSVKLDDGKHSPGFTVGEVGVRHVVCIRQRLSKKRFIPVSISTSTPPQEFARARTITFTDRFVGKNETNFPLELRVAEFGEASSITEVPPLSKAPIQWEFDTTNLEIDGISFSRSEIPLVQVRLAGSRVWSPPFSPNMLAGRVKLYYGTSLKTTLSIHSSAIAAVTYTTFSVSSTPNFQVNNLTSWPAKVFQVPPRPEDPTDVTHCPQMTTADCWLNELDVTPPVRIKLMYDSKKMVVEVDVTKLGEKEVCLREIHLLASCPYFVALRMGGNSVCADILPKHHNMCFYVRLVRARGLMGRDTRICGPNTSDPFAKMSVDGRIPVEGGACTKVIHNTTNPDYAPDWKTFALYEVDSTLTMTLFDEDVIKDDFLGQLELPLRELYPQRKGRRVFELHSRAGGEDWDVLRSQNHKSFGTVTIDFIFAPADEQPDFDEELPVRGPVPANWPLTCSVALSMSVSVCGEVQGRLREIAFLDLQDINLVVARESDGFFSGLLDIAGMQIDNSMDFAVSQVILAAADDKDPRPAFRCCFSRLKYKSFLVQAGYLGCFVKPMKLVLGDSDVLALHQGFQACLKAVSERQIDLRDLTRMFTELDEPSRTEIARQAVQMYVRVREVLFHKVKPEITWLGMMRETTALPQLQTWGLSFVSIDGAKITLPEYRGANILFRKEELRTVFRQHYQPAVVKSAVVLLGHTAFGSPIAVIRAIWVGIAEFFTEVADGLGQSSVTAVGRGAFFGLYSLLCRALAAFFAVLATVCDFISTLCGLVDSLGGGESYQRRYRINKRLYLPRSLWQGFLYGGGQLANSLRYGIGGVVAKPYRGMRTNGCIGGMRGMVIGVVGLVAKPPQGVLDLMATISKGAIASINGPNRSKRRRPPRVILDGTMTPYNHGCSEAYHLLCMLNLSGSGTMYGRFLGTEYYVHHVTGPFSDTLYIVSTHRVLHLYKSPYREGVSLLWDLDINKVQKVERQDSDGKHHLCFIKYGKERPSRKVTLTDSGAAQAFVQILGDAFPRIDCSDALGPLQWGHLGGLHRPAHTVVNVPPSQRTTSHQNLDAMRRVMEGNNAVVLAQELKKMMELLREKSYGKWMRGLPDPAESRKRK